MKIITQKYEIDNTVSSKISSFLRFTGWAQY